MKRYWFTAVIIVLLVALGGCASSQAQEAEVSSAPSTTECVTSAPESVPESETVSRQKLKFSVKDAEDSGYIGIPQEELGEKCDTEITYISLSDVSIDLNGEVISLGEAIHTGKLTTPEIFAFARMDARNGFCQETSVSEHGLTHFSYLYPECELQIAYDVYETPDGRQTLIDEISVCQITDSQRSTDYFYVDETSEWGYFLDREDWGLTLEASSVSPTQITINYTQRQGQEIGELSLEDYMLFAVENSGTADRTSRYLARSGQDTDEFPIPIQSDGSGQITLDWSDLVGALDPGTYDLLVTVSDNYEESNVHPLMVNFYDKQSYHVMFSIE